jgi:hypothetical protein
VDIRKLLWGARVSYVDGAITKLVELFLARRITRNSPSAARKRRSASMQLPPVSQSHTAPFAEKFQSRTVVSSSGLLR